MMNRRGEAAERFAERRRREDEAPRLKDVVPDLLACKIEIEERRPSITSPEIAHTRHLIVDRAPALFVIPCSDPSCRDGGHDIGSTLLRGLRDRKSPVRGEDTCHGSIGASHCGRILSYSAIAQYAPNS